MPDIFGFRFAVLTSVLEFETRRPHRSFTAKNAMTAKTIAKCPFH